MSVQTPVVFLEGENVYLRPLCTSTDLAAAQRWINDPEVRQFIRNTHPLSLSNEKEWFDHLSPTSPHFAVVLREGDRHIGNFGLHRIDPVHRNATAGALIGEKDCWGKGYGTEALKLLLAYAFDELNLIRVEATALATNERSIRMQVRCGFVVEGRCRSAFFVGGAWVDEVILGILRREWQRA